MGDLRDMSTLDGRKRLNDDLSRCKASIDEVLFCLGQNSSDEKEVTSLSE